jgi:hypothetical protein
MTYRAIFQYNPWTYETAALLPGCDPYNNPGACDPQNFSDLASAIAYANSRGETLVTVNSVDEAVEVARGQLTLPASRIVAGTAGASDLAASLGGGSSLAWMLLAGAALFFLMPKKRGRGSAGGASAGFDI